MKLFLIVFHAIHNSQSTMRSDDDNDDDYANDNKDDDNAKDTYKCVAFEKK